jgi:hypothetical protein
VYFRKKLFFISSVFYQQLLLRLLQLLQSELELKMNTTTTNNPTMEMKSYRVGMDPDFGRGSPMKLMRKAFVHVVPGTELEIRFDGKVIYERRFGNTTESHEIEVSVKDVNPYPNCNFWVDDRFVLPAPGVVYMQEIEVRTNAVSVRVEANTFMDK